MATVNLTAERLRELLHYNPDTGAFTNRIRRTNRICVGAPAGTTHPLSGYLIIKIDRKNYRASRLAFLYMNGEWPKFQADHIEGVRLNNRWSNLRDVPQVINLQNKSACRADSRSGLVGVRKMSKSTRKGAQITAHGVKHWLGVFDTAAEAHAAYIEAKRRLHPESSLALKHQGTPE